MFGLDELKQTRYFREVAEEAAKKGWEEGYLEGKLESVPRLLQLGLTVEQIAMAFDLNIELVTADKAYETIQNQESEN